MIACKYDQYIDTMDGDTFTLCVDMLWPILSYKYLKREDVRVVDLKERVYQLAMAYAPEPKQPVPKGKIVPGTLDKYIEAIRFSFENGYLPTKKDSEAEKYSKRAWDIINSYRKSDDPFSEMEDLFVIYLCLTRQAFVSYTGKGIQPVESIKLEICVEDRTLLESIRTFSFEKAAPALVKAVAKPEKQDQRQKDFAYLNNVLLYCNMFQLKSEIGKEDGK